MANPNIAELTVTSALYNRTKKMADNVTLMNALLYRLKEKGKVKPVSGGRQIMQELEYAENGTVTRFSGYDEVDISPSDVFTAAVFDYKQYAVAVSISRLEQLQNAGKEQMIDLLEARIQNAERSLLNTIAVDCYSAGTASNSKQIGGLQLLVPDDPTTGSPGGINRATWTFWRSYVYDFSVAGVTPSSTTIQTSMNTAYMNVTRGKDHPDLMVADNTYYGYFLGSLQNIQRMTNPKLAELGFENTKFLGADVIFDGGIGGGCPANHVYLLNTDYIHLRPHRDENFVVSDDRFSTNQLAMIKLISWAGNMTLSNGSLQGVMIA